MNRPSFEKLPEIDTTLENPSTEEFVMKPIMVILGRDFEQGKSLFAKLGFTAFKGWIETEKARYIYASRIQQFMALDAKYAFVVILPGAPSYLVNAAHLRFYEGNIAKVGISDFLQLIKGELLN